jgi:hypothetical protein
MISGRCTRHLHIDVLHRQPLKQIEDVVRFVEVIVHCRRQHCHIYLDHKLNPPMLTKYHSSITCWINFLLALSAA